MEKGQYTVDGACQGPSPLKDWRRLAIRYDCCAPVSRSAVLLAATVLFW